MSCPPCQAGVQFCGTDGACHPYDCEAWYTLGPNNFTGYNTSGFVEPLVCQSGDFSAVPERGVVYGCNFYSGLPISPGRGVGMAFTRRCQADFSSVNGFHTEFTCYEMDATTSYLQFLDTVASETISCEDPNESPRYIYAVHYGYDLVGSDEERTYEETVGPGSGVAFNSTLAGGTMTSLLVEFDPTAAPTARPTFPPFSTSSAPRLHGFPVWRSFDTIGFLVGWVMLRLILFII